MNAAKKFTRCTRRARVCARALSSVLALSWYVGVPAAAQPVVERDPVPAALHVNGDGSCLDRSDIEREIRVRSTRVRIVDEHAGIPELRVDVKRTPSRALRIGMDVLWPDGRRSQRELAADSCEEAETAVAFLIALTLDPNARAATANDEGAARDEQPARAEPSPPVPTTPESAAPADVAPSETEPPAATSPTPATPPNAAADGGTTNPQDAAGVLELAFGGQLQAGAAPHVMYGIVVRAMLPMHGHGLWAPAIQLSAARVWRSHWVDPAGVADFQLSTVQLDFCPLGVLARPLTARACVGGGVGSLTAQGSRTYARQSSARLWADLGSSVLLSLSLTPWLQVEVGAGVAAPLRRDHFAFRPKEFHRVSALCWETQIGLGVRFP